MNIFISWSGSKSNQLAKEFKRWLKLVIKDLDPFFSSQDMTKGYRWNLQLTERLNETEIGIVLMTKENLNSPWLFFEAGALSKNFSTGFVCTILFDVDNSDVHKALSQFQTTKFSEEDILKLIKDIHKQINSPLSKKQMANNFKKYWPAFSQKIKDILLQPYTHYGNVKLFIDSIESKECNGSSLKKWAIMV
jgi:TIR domain